MDTNRYEQILNYSGCGNTVNANGPAGRQLILDSLRNWCVRRAARRIASLASVGDPIADSQGD